MSANDSSLKAEDMRQLLNSINGHDVGRVMPVKTIYNLIDNGCSLDDFKSSIGQGNDLVFVFITSDNYKFAIGIHSVDCTVDRYVKDPRAFAMILGNDAMAPRNVISDPAVAFRCTATGIQFGDGDIKFFHNGFNADATQKSFPVALHPSANFEVRAFEVFTMSSLTSLVPLNLPYEHIEMTPAKEAELAYSINKRCAKILARCGGVVPQINLIVNGDTAAGKSSVINRILSSFQRELVDRAAAQPSSTAVTSKFDSYAVDVDTSFFPELPDEMPFCIFDAPGTEPRRHQTVEGVTTTIYDNGVRAYMLCGNLPVGTEITPTSDIHMKMRGFVFEPVPAQQMHSVILVVSALNALGPASVRSLRTTIDQVRRAGLELRITVFLTMVDKVDTNLVLHPGEIYKSVKVADLRLRVAQALDLDPKCVFPVINDPDAVMVRPVYSIPLFMGIMAALQAADDGYFESLRRQQKRLQAATRPPSARPATAGSNPQYFED